MTKPNLYKNIASDIIIKCVNAAMDDPDIVEYFKEFNIEILGINGVAVNNDGKEKGFVLSIKDNNVDEVKQVEVNLSVKKTSYDNFNQYKDYKTKLLEYERITGNKVKQGTKKQVIPFETLPENITNKIDSLDSLTKEVFPND